MNWKGMLIPGSAFRSVTSECGEKPVEAKYGRLDVLHMRLHQRQVELILRSLRE